ncbi:MAG: hypothetical protein ACXADY_17840 [Candidatus Hodarchaeales archaeon]|jgi:hypothetical protein
MNYKGKMAWESIKLAYPSSEFPQSLALRVLILLAFKDSPKQNLRFILELLGMKSVEEKNELVREIYNLFRTGVVAVHPGFPQLVKEIYGDELAKIDLHLLVPLSDCVKEIQEEIIKMRFRHNTRHK